MTPEELAQAREYEAEAIADSAPDVDEQRNNG